MCSVAFVCSIVQLYTIMADGKSKETNETPGYVHQPRDDAYGKAFSKHFRSLELTVINDTKTVTLSFPEEGGDYFCTGAWFELYPPNIPPGKFSKGFVTNKSIAPTGVGGGLMFEIESFDAASTEQSTNGGEKTSAIDCTTNGTEATANTNCTKEATDGAEATSNTNQATNATKKTDNWFYKCSTWKLQDIHFSHHKYKVGCKVRL